MRKLYTLSLNWFIVLCLSFLCAGCSKVSQENFDKIKPNMTLQEVVAILGEPTSSDSINIAGISGTSAVWQGNNAEINIQFLNNKVTVKLFNKPSKVDNTKDPDTIDTN